MKRRELLKKIGGSILGIFTIPKILNAKGRNLTLWYDSVEVPINYYYENLTVNSTEDGNKKIPTSGRLPDSNWLKECAENGNGYVRIGLVPTSAKRGNPDKASYILKITPIKNSVSRTVMTKANENQL